MNKIIQDIGKYHYILTTLKKAVMLGCSNTNKEAKKEANKIIKKNGEKWEELYVIKLKLSKISEKILRENNESKIKTVGGPIKIDIIFYQIINSKIKKLTDFSLNNNIYITENFLEKYKLSKKVLKKIALLTTNRNLSNKIFVINKIDKFIKN